MTNLTIFQCYVGFVGNKLINESWIYTRTGRSGLKINSLNMLIESVEMELKVYIRFDPRLTTNRELRI